MTWPGATGHLPEGHRLPAVLRDAWSDTAGGPALRERGVTCGSDLHLYTAVGISTLQFGPGDIKVAHRAGERVSVRETVAVARALVVGVLRTVGTT